MNTILTVKDLKKTYSGFQLDGLSFTLPEGCITGFIGANGAGKTTTIRCLLGLARAEGGAITAFGETFTTPSAKVKDRLGVVLDGDCFYEDLTIAQMKSIIAPAYSQWDEGEFRRYLDRFGLQPKQVIKTLSKGMRMKFALALALSHHAELLIMDEPTSGLDPLVRSELLDMLLEYVAPGGRSVFFSTHITSDLDKLADVLVLIDNGRLVFQQDKDALLDGHRLVKGAGPADGVRDLFLTLNETPYGFTGLTAKPAALRTRLPDALLEPPTVEDIMLAYLKGGVSA